MDFIAVLQLVLDFLADCRGTRSRETVLQSMELRGPFERLAFRLFMRRQGFSVHEIRQSLAMYDTAIADGIADEREDREAILVAAEEQAQAAGKSLAGDKVVGPTTGGVIAGCFALMLIPSQTFASDIPSFASTIHVATPMEQRVEGLESSIDDLKAMLAEAMKPAPEPEKPAAPQKIYEHKVARRPGPRWSYSGTIDSHLQEHGYTSDQIAGLSHWEKEALHDNEHNGYRNTLEMVEVTAKKSRPPRIENSRTVWQSVYSQPVCVNGVCYYPN